MEEGNQLSPAVLLHLPVPSSPRTASAMLGGDRVGTTEPAMVPSSHGWELVAAPVMAPSWNSSKLAAVRGMAPSSHGWASVAVLAKETYLARTSHRVG